MIGSTQAFVWDWTSTKPQNLGYLYSMLPPTVSYKLWRDLQGPFSSAVAATMVVTCMPGYFLQASLVKYRLKKC